MTDLRTAAQQALERLRKYHYGNGFAEDAECIADLEAALAQQAEPTVTEDMKSAVRWAPSSAYWSERLREFFGPDAREGIDALERRLAKAQQAEPVAGKVVAWGVCANIDGEWQLQHPVFVGDEQGKVNAEFERASYSGPQPLEVRPLGVVTATAQQAEPVQDEPVHDRHGACPTHCCPIHGCKYMHDDCPVVSGAVKPVYPRNNGCESCAEDALAQQAEPAQDQRCRAEPRSDGDFVCDCKIGECPGRSVEPAQEPVAWRWGYRSVTTGEMDWRGYVEIAAHPNLRSPEIIIEPLYIAPPQRKLVPLTEEEIKTAFHAARNAKLGASQDNSRHRLSVIEIARAVEKASWEKNHG